VFITKEIVNHQTMEKTSSDSNVTSETVSSSPSIGVDGGVSARGTKSGRGNKSKSTDAKETFTISGDAKSTTIIGDAKSTTIIHEPLQHDILCGQDKTWSNHYGNQIFRNLLMEHLPTYRTGNKKTKMALTKQIICTLKTKYNCRFIRPIKQNESSNIASWEEVNDNLSRDKVSHALR
jgi:hypothetical protein